MEVVFNYAKYEGGHPLLGDKGSAMGGTLHVGTGGVGMGTFKIKKMIPMALVESFEVVGANVAKSKVGAVAAFGVLGLAAKGSKQQTGLIVHTSDGSAAYFTIDKMSEIQVRAKLAPVLAASFKAFTGEPNPLDALIEDEPAAESDVSESQTDAVSQVRELAQMRDDGWISEDEFIAARARVRDATPLVNQLSRLADLRDDESLTEDEFVAGKALLVSTPLVDQLCDLADRRDDGAVTDEDFAAAKAQLLQMRADGLGGDSSSRRRRPKS